MSDMVTAVGVPIPGEEPKAASVAAQPPASPKQLHKALAAEIVDGVYFGLNEHVYHAVERLSGSGLQALAVSAATFWRDSWLNPDPPEPGETLSTARLIGSAYHCARLEPYDFVKRYARQLTKEEMPPGTLLSGADIERALAARDQPKTQPGEVVLEKAHRLRAAGFPGAIWHLAEEAWQAASAGKIGLPGKVWDDIERDMDRLTLNKPVWALIDDVDPGATEVSIFWTDENGIKMKARIDKLYADRWVDLKTFDNSRGLPLETALANAFRYNRYYMQATVHREAVTALRYGGLQVQGDATQEQHELIAKLRLAEPEPVCWYLFVEKGGAPNILARRFDFKDEDGRNTMLHQRGANDVARSKQQFKLYSDVYAPGDHWFPLDAARSFDELDFSPGWLEGKFE